MRSARAALVAGVMLAANAEGYARLGSTIDLSLFAR